MRDEVINNIENGVQIQDFCQRNSTFMKSQSFSIYDLKNFDNLNSSKIIAHSSLGLIYESQNKLNKQTFVIKRMELDLLEKLQLRQKIMDLGNLLINIHHENIIRVKSIIANEKEIFFIMQKINFKCNLSQLIKSRKSLFNEQEIFRIFVQILKAIVFLNEFNITHLDLQSNNILVDCDYKVYLTDFKCFTVISSENKKLKQNHLKLESLSLGSILFELLNGFPICSDIMNSFDLSKKIIDYEIKIQRKDVSNSCIDLLEKLLNYNPIKRIFCQDVFSHQWFLEMEKSYKNESSFFKEKPDLLNENIDFNEGSLDNQNGLRIKTKKLNEIEQENNKLLDKILTGFSKKNRKITSESVLSTDPSKKLFNSQIKTDYENEDFKDKEKSELEKIFRCPSLSTSIQSKKTKISKKDYLEIMNSCRILDRFKDSNKNESEKELNKFTKSIFFFKK